MTVQIDGGCCTGCPKPTEPPCVRLCPGDLLFREGGALSVRDEADCWDCAACVKACPHGALSLALPPELGGRGSSLSATTARHVTHWHLSRCDGTADHFETPFRNHRR